MSIEIKVPSVGESITEVQVSKWLKNEGDRVERDEPLVELETEKTTLEVPAPQAGTLASIKVPEGEFTEIDAVLAVIEPGGEAAEAEKPDEKEEKSPEASEEPEEQKKPEKKEKEAAKPPKTETKKKPAAAEESAREREALEERFSAVKDGGGPKAAPSPEPRLRQPQARIMPSARRLMAEQDLQPADVQGSGPGGRVLKEDVIHAVGQAAAEEEAQPPGKTPEGEEEREKPREDAAPEAVEEAESPALEANRGEEVVPMSPMRLRIAARLVEAQQTAALLTTFNEIDMSRVMRLRRQYQETFQKEYGIKLGFMSFFVKASVEALKRFPQVNAQIRGRQIVYFNYYDIGIAIGSGRGLVVPVLRNAESMGLADIEREIDRLATRVQNKKLEPEELEGGTFTITNGGIYGSMLSTPIINPPQSGILGMHKIEERAVVREGKIVARPVMYVALSYDHRLVDGREAVQFLHHLKDVIEEPSRMLLEV